jgi:hypothetical protein
MTQTRSSTHLGRASFGRGWLARLPVTLAVGLMPLVALSGCDKPKPASPEAVITTAKQMVADNHAEQLYTLIYTESAREKRVWREVGSLMGHLQQLAVSVNETFPEEVAKLREQAEEAAENGQASSLIASVLTGQSRNRNRAPDGRRRPQPNRAPSEQALTDIFAALIADPFAFLEEQEERLGTEFVSPELSALTWGGKMLLPPLGILLKESEGSWYILLPTNMPQIKDNLPDNEEFWDALPELIRVFDNMIVDLERDVSSGKVQDLASLSEQAGKKAFIPMMIAAYAIGKAAEGEEEPPEAATPEPASPDEDPTEPATEVGGPVPSGG